MGFETSLDEDMKDLGNSNRLGFRGVAIMATAFGAVAVGAFAIGAVIIWRLAIRRVVVESAEFKSLEIQDLTVTRLRAAEVTVTDSFKVPEAISIARPNHENAP